LALDANIAMDPVEPVHREVEAIAVLILKEEEVVRQAAHGKVDEALVDADPVIHMDDEIPLLEIAQGVQERPGGRMVQSSPSGFFAIELSLGHDDEKLIRPDEAPREATAQNLGDWGVHRHAAEGLGGEERVNVIIGEDLLEPAALLGGAADEKGAQPPPLPINEPQGQGFQKPLPLRVAQDFLAQGFVIPNAKVEHGARVARPLTREADGPEGCPPRLFGRVVQRQAVLKDAGMAFQVGGKLTRGEEIGFSRWRPPLLPIALGLGKALRDLVSEAAVVGKDH
jgi:hypothetical protein